MIRRNDPPPQKRPPVMMQAFDYGEADHDDSSGALALLVALMAPAALLFWVAVAWFCWKRWL